MKNFSLLALLVLFTIFRTADAQSTAISNDYIEGSLAAFKSKCAELPAAVQRFEQEGKQSSADALKDSMYTMCECVPKKLQSMRTALSAAELNAKISGNQFNDKFTAPIVEQCAAEQLRRAYSSDRCQYRSIAKNKKTPLQYCSCMAKHLESISNAEIMKISNEIATYVHQTVEAKTKGLPAPVRSLSVQKFYALDTTCSAE